MRIAVKSLKTLKRAADRGAVNAAAPWSMSARMTLYMVVCGACLLWRRQPRVQGFWESSNTIPPPETRLGDKLGLPFAGQSQKNRRGPFFWRAKAQYVSQPPPERTPQRTPSHQERTVTISLKLLFSNGIDRRRPVRGFPASSSTRAERPRGSRGVAAIHQRHAISKAQKRQPKRLQRGSPRPPCSSRPRQQAARASPRPSCSACSE